MSRDELRHIARQILDPGGEYNVPGSWSAKLAQGYIDLERKLIEHHNISLVRGNVGDTCPICGDQKEEGDAERRHQ